MTKDINDMTDNIPMPGDCARTFILLLDFLLARRRKRAIGEKLNRQTADHANAIARELCKRIEHARRHEDADRALTLFEVMVALELTSALSAGNLGWIVQKAGQQIAPSESRQRAIEYGLTLWLYGNGPVDRDIVALAEAKQPGRRSTSLNRLVLWIEPTRSRWKAFAEGIWSAYQCEHGVQCFDRDRDQELLDRFAPYERSPMRLLQEKGEAARAALREAASESGPAQALLREWMRRDESDSWLVR